MHEYAQTRMGESSLKPLTKEVYNKLINARGELLAEYPVTQLLSDLQEAKAQNLTYASLYIERLLDNFKRQIPISMDHVNQIAVLSSSGQVINLMKGNGAV